MGESSRMIEFQVANNVAGSSEVTVLSFTVSGTGHSINSVIVEGDARAKWTVLVNLAKIGTVRTSVSNPKQSRKFYKFSLSNTDIVDIKVIHEEATTRNFTATLNFV